MAGGKFTEAQRKACWERAGGCCEVCGYRLPEKGWNLHHRQGRGMGGTRRKVTCADGLVVCGMGNTSGCHRLMDTEREWAKARGFVVLRSFVPALIPVLIRGEWGYLTADGGFEVAEPEETERLNERLAA